MTVLFFMWGFMTVFNDILIPRFKEAFKLDYFHAMLVQLAFFGAYFVGSLLYFLISARAGDPIAKIGYKNGVVIGLLISAAGSALFWPAASRGRQDRTRRGRPQISSRRAGCHRNLYVCGRRGFRRQHHH